MRHAAAIIVCSIAFLVGCSKSPPEGDVLRLALETSPNKLDPAFVVDVAEGQICSLIYQGLVRFAPTGEVVPDAALRWEIDPDGRRYVFRLDPLARFSDGRRVTAGDVIASFERILSPDERSPRTWVLDRIRGAPAYVDGKASSIDGLSSPDDSTVVVELEEPFRPFLQLLAMPAAYIVAAKDDGGNTQPAATDEASSGPVSLAGQPVGSGRWVLTRWNRGDALELEPNPFYPGPQPRIGGVRFRIIPEAFTRIAEFESGSLDVLRIPHAELDRFLDDDTRRHLIQTQSELRVVYIGLNNQKGPLSDIRVRHALNMGVDVDRVVEVLTRGHAVRATGAIPPALPGYETRTPYKFDPDRARKLLAEAGYADGLELEIWQRDSPEGNRVVEAVQGYLLELGVRVRIVKREWSAFKEAVSRGRVDAFFLDWYADYPDAENFLYPLFHSENAGGGGNRSFYSNPEVDRLIELSQRSPETGGGGALYSRIDRLIYDDAPWLYLYFPTAFVIVSPRVQGYTFPVVYLGEDLSTVSITVEGAP